MLRHFEILTAMAFACAMPAAAQEPAAAPADPAVCEFHAWPGDALMSVYLGFVNGGTVNGQIQGRPGYPAVPADLLGTALQAALLGEAHPERLFAHPDYRLIVHDSALESRVIRNARGRLGESASPCYAELIVDDVILQQDWVNGSKLKILFHYRDFGPHNEPSTRFSTWAESNLTAFPPHQAGQMEAALEDVRQTFRRNIERFAAMAMRPPRRRR